MKFPNNPFTRAIAAGQSQIGLWINLCSPLAADVIAPAGYDWVVLDMEHTPNDYHTLLSQLQSFESSPTVPLVRPEWNDPVIIKRLLDMGAPGLIFPMIQSVEEAEKAVAATRYPPRGVRGLAGSVRANKYGRVDDYLERVEEETTVIIQLETAAAAANAEAIASVDGVSGVFFGPADISADIGKLGDTMNPAVWDVIKPAAAKLRAMGMPTGTLVTDADFAAELLKEGLTFVACGTDSSLLARGADSLLATVKARSS